MAYFLGIDGGGTHTTAWLGDERGHVLARAEAGPSNPLKVGFESAQRELLRAARSALRGGNISGGKRHKLEGICAGLAGVDRRQVHRRLFTWLRSRIPARHHLLTVDAAIALRAAVGEASGIIVISGTGSIAFGQDERSRIVRAGGWGIPFDDLGSGYDLGRKAIMAALQNFDGRGSHTMLTQKICRALGMKVITQVVLRPPTQQQTAALFPLVLEAARQHDAVARLLCEQAGRDLGDLALAVIRRFGWQRRSFPVACAGGVLKASATIRAALAHRVLEYARRAEVCVLRREPVEGALALARNLSAQPWQ